MTRLASAYQRADGWIVDPCVDHKGLEKLSDRDNRGVNR